jgi:hypothetical protein
MNDIITYYYQMMTAKNYYNHSRIYQTFKIDIVKNYLLNKKKELEPCLRF